MVQHWSLLKVGQKIWVDIVQLGFRRKGTIRYIGAVNGSASLNHRYYMPNLETHEGIENLYKNQETFFKTT